MNAIRHLAPAYADSRQVAPPHARVDTQPDVGLAKSSPHHLGCYSIRPPRWACIYTHPQAETWACTNLSRAGYRAYLPTYATRIRDRALPTMWHTVTRPLFPRYLFLMFDHLDTSWSPVRAIPGVADLVRSGQEPHYASSAVIEALQAGDDARRSVSTNSTQWAPGAACSLATGAFRGHDAVVIAVETDRVVVGVMCFGAVRQLRVAADCLMARE